MKDNAWKAWIAGLITRLLVVLTVISYVMFRGGTDLRIIIGFNLAIIVIASLRFMYVVVANR